LGLDDRNGIETALASPDLGLVKMLTDGTAVDLERGGQLADPGATLVCPE
jgi:hypothetical protein